MGKIKVMDEILANKIAAGEVVEKCSSVVKELVENAIDAESSEIKIELIDSGTKEIKVTDNGYGMDKDDAILAFGRHATSKIKSERDLFHINTLGFRGEALAAISSVSVIELITSTGNIGTIVNIKGGKIESVSNGDSRKGTIISVKNLFFNTPARLKHLNNLYTELAYVTEYINKLSLSHPEIKFTLTNNGSTIISTDGAGSLLKTIKNVYGIETVKKMIDVSASNEDYEVSGFISLPELNRSNKNHITILVNGRIVKNTYLNKIINDSYHSYKPDNRYPIVVLNIKCDPSLIDVNIHPTKMDIKFSKIEGLTLTIEKMIKDKITHINLIPKIEEVKSIAYNSNTEFVGLELFRETENIIVNNDFIANEEKETYFAEKTVVLEEKMEEIYPIGLVHGTYIIGQNELGMYLIDQHAAKERINYEFYLEKLGNPTNNSIDLLFPIIIELPINEYMLIKERLNILTDMNFKIEEFGINSFVVKGHPTWLPKNYEEEAIRKIIDIILEYGNNFSILKFNEQAATMMSCKLSIKANENITLKEMEILINDLRKCKNPFNCPHGRPTVISFTNMELEKLFKRSGFESLK